MPSTALTHCSTLQNRRQPALTASNECQLAHEFISLVGFTVEEEECKFVWVLEHSFVKGIVAQFFLSVKSHVLESNGVWYC